MAESVIEELHSTFVDGDDNLVFEKCDQLKREIGIGKRVSKNSATSGASDRVRVKLSYLIFSRCK